MGDSAAFPQVWVLRHSFPFKMISSRIMMAQSNVDRARSRSPLRGALQDWFPCSSCWDSYFESSTNADFGNLMLILSSSFFRHWNPLLTTHGRFCLCVCMQFLFRHLTLLHLKLKEVRFGRKPQGAQATKFVGMYQWTGWPFLWCGTLDNWWQLCRCGWQLGAQCSQRSFNTLERKLGWWQRRRCLVPSRSQMFL